MEYINIILDIVIIALALWILWMLIGYGGFIGKALKFIGVGTVVIGAAQLVETASIHLLNLQTETTEFIHRILLLIGFVIIAWTYYKLMKKDLV